MPGSKSSSIGATSSMTLHSVCAVEIATCAWAMLRRTRHDRARVRAGLAKDEVGLERVAGRFNGGQHRRGRESTEELAVEESRRLCVRHPRRALPQLLSTPSDPAASLWTCATPEFLHRTDEGWRDDDEHVVTAARAASMKGTKGLKCPARPVEQKRTFTARHPFRRSSDTKRPKRPNSGPD